jgi:hypothetical protein
MSTNAKEKVNETRKYNHYPWPMGVPGTLLKTKEKLM